MLHLFIFENMIIAYNGGEIQIIGYENLTKKIKKRDCVYNYLTKFVNLLKTYKKL